MNNKKSDYENALNHKYRVEPMGEFVPGVTTVINIMSKPALPWAAAKIAAETAVKLMHAGTHSYEALINEARGSFDKEWKAKAARGTRVHDVAERWSRGEEVGVLPEDAGFVDALEFFHLEHSPVFEMVECVVLNRGLAYGGRFDAIVTMDGLTTLCDYKTGGEYPYDVALQAAAYMDCQLADYNIDGSLAGLRPLPKLDGARTIYLREDGTYKVSDPFESVSQVDATLAFQSALQLYKINQKINKQIKENHAEQ